MSPDSLSIDSQRGVGGVFTWTLFGSEAVNAVSDLRWMIVLILFLIFADYYFGTRDSKQKYLIAKKNNDSDAIEEFRFHRSRSIRRSANKFCDYMTLLLVGCILGLAITEPFGWCSHVITSGIGLCVGIIAEIFSIIEHALSLSGIEVRHGVIRSVIWAFIMEFAKSKSPSIGNAIESATNAAKKSKEEEESDDSSIG